MAGHRLSAVLVLASLSIQSCAAHRSLISAEAAAPPPHQSEGHARLEGDTLVFVSTDHPSQAGESVTGPMDRVVVSDSGSVRFETTDPVRAIVVAVGIAAASFLVMLVALAGTAN